jgi:hypothetical protein
MEQRRELRRRRALGRLQFHLLVQQLGLFQLDAQRILLRTDAALVRAERGGVQVAHEFEVPQRDSCAGLSHASS